MRNLEVGYELEALLLMGQCIDIAAKSREQVRTDRQIDGLMDRGMVDGMIDR